jgi:hypothetical protein
MMGEIIDLTRYFGDQGLSLGRISCKADQTAPSEAQRMRRLRSGLWPSPRRSRVSRKTGEFQFFAVMDTKTAPIGQ